MLNMEQPDAFNGALGRFLDKWVRRDGREGRGRGRMDLGLTGKIAIVTGCDSGA